MVEEIITALSRIRWLFVIARNSSFTYRGQPVDINGSAASSASDTSCGRFSPQSGWLGTITAQLIDALSGTHLWADRFDGSLEDIFDLQDKVAFSVASVIEPILQAATINLTAYDLYLRALAAVFQRRRSGLSRLWGFSIGQSPWIGINRRQHCPGRRSVICDSSETAEPKSQRHPAKPALILLGGHLKWEKRPAGPRQCRGCTGVVRRGHRRDDRTDRPGTGAQPELRPRVVS